MEAIFIPCSIDGIAFKRVRIRKSGPITEVRKFEFYNKEMPIIKLEGLKYIVKSTGEVLEMNRTENRSDNLSSLSISFSNLRSLINKHFTGRKNEIWITLTYRENMQDLKQLYFDRKNFWKKVQYKYPYLNLQYISIVEPQERGAWHMHELWKSNILSYKSMALFIKQSDLLALWGHGSVFVKRLKCGDNIGAYVSAYLSNMPDNGKGTEGSKKWVKGARLAFYPPHFRLYRSSRGLKASGWYDARDNEVSAIEANKANYERLDGIYKVGERVQSIYYAQYKNNS